MDEILRSGSISSCRRYEGVVCSKTAAAKTAVLASNRPIAVHFIVLLLVVGTLLVLHLLLLAASACCANALRCEAAKAIMRLKEAPGISRSV